MYYSVFPSHYLRQILVTLFLKKRRVVLVENSSDVCFSFAFEAGQKYANVTENTLPQYLLQSFVLKWKV